MKYLTDIEIAQGCKLRPIHDIAKTAGIPEDHIVPYGRYKAKIDCRLLHGMPNRQGKLVLVTAINPTAAGEGKTTTAVGLADALRRLDQQVVVAIREPSLGPVFGVKGGAAGGGYAQVVPMEDINLHFTGDLHAITAANNLLAAMVDNHLYQGNRLGLDPRRITWRRCMDMNDRQLRNIVSGLSGRINGVPREDGFDITAASEIMAVLCLSSDIMDLRERLSRIIVGYTREGQPVTAKQLGAHGAMTALLKEALNPNLVQTLEGTPALVHGGPFANIAHGCNSLIATRMAMGLGAYAITEAGFGADLGAEKFIDIKCRVGGVRPSAVVVVATVRALKLHGGADKKALAEENIQALAKGIPNLLRHVENMDEVFHMPVVVAINRFATDTEEELKLVEEECARLGVKAVLSEVWEKGGAGGEKLAKEVMRLSETKRTLRYSYALDDSIEDKLRHIARRVYGAADVILTPGAQAQAKQLELLGFGRLPVCVAKTQYSFSDDPKLLGAPEDFPITVRKIRVSAGAGFLVALTGDIMTMPGLSKAPAAQSIDVDARGRVTGLF